MNDPYEILGVSRDASPDEVKKAYRKKARENHPDLNPGDPHAEERMNEVNEAYDRITNPEKYRASDARRRGAGYGYAGSSGYPGYGGWPGSAGGSSSAGGSGGNSGGYPGSGNPYGGSGVPGEDFPYGWTTVDFVDLEDLFNGFANAGGRPGQRQTEQRVQDYEQQGRRRGFTTRGIDPSWCCCAAMLCPSLCVNFPIICCI